MQIKATIMCHLSDLLPSRRMAMLKNTQKITNVSKDVDELKPSSTIGGSLKWCSHLENSWVAPL